MLKAKSLLKPKQVAERLNISVRTVRNMCMDGELPAFKVRGQWRIRADFENWIDRSSERE